MKIVVYGPDKRTGVLRDGSVVDLSGAFAKYATEKNNEAHPIELAEALVPSDLARLIEAGPRALENAAEALDYLFGQAHDQKDPRGAALVYPAAAVQAVAAVIPEARERRLPFELGRCLLVLGTAQRKARQRREAAISLDEAIGIFGQLGAARWQKLAEGQRARLAAVGDDSLTPTD